MQRARKIQKKQHKCSFSNPLYDRICCTGDVFLLLYEQVAKPLLIALGCEQ